MNVRAFAPSPMGAGCRDTVPFQSLGPGLDRCFSLGSLQGLRLLQISPFQGTVAGTETEGRIQEACSTQVAQRVPSNPLRVVPCTAECGPVGGAAVRTTTQPVLLHALSMAAVPT